MRQIHSEEKEQFRKLFEQQQIDKLDDRCQILNEFLNIEHHVTENEFIQLLEENEHSFDPAFVRDTLKLMCQFGFAQTRRFDNGLIRYEHRHLSQHHDHMICTKCGKILEFKNEELEALQIRIAASYHFCILEHKMEIYGICSDCLQLRTSQIPLYIAKPGERLIIKDFTGGASSRMRLLTMGLRVGDEIEVISNIGKGQVVISLDFHRYAIGRSLAQKILVQPVSLTG
jgi:Fur family ferric uptake transcriptional regulator